MLIVNYMEDKSNIEYLDKKCTRDESFSLIEVIYYVKSKGDDKAYGHSKYIHQDKSKSNKEIKCL